LIFGIGNFQRRCKETYPAKQQKRKIHCFERFVTIGNTARDTKERHQENPDPKIKEK